MKFKALFFYFLNNIIESQSIMLEVLLNLKRSITQKSLDLKNLLVPCNHELSSIKRRYNILYFLEQLLNKINEYAFNLLF